MLVQMPGQLENPNFDKTGEDAGLTILQSINCQLEHGEQNKGINLQSTVQIFSNPSETSPNLPLTNDSVNDIQATAHNPIGDWTYIGPKAILG